MLRYAVKLEREGDHILVAFPDFPDVHTYGEDEQEALVRAVDALETYFMGMIEDKKEIPDPGKLKRRDKTVVLPALTEAKLKLYSLMRSSKIGKAELATRMNCHLPQIDRLLDLSHHSKLDQIEQAFLAIGKRITISIEEAA